MKRSRSMSFSMSVNGLPVCLAYSSLSLLRRYKISRAWISMSEAVPCVPPDGWCIMMRACGRAWRWPGRPAASRNDPIEAAIPMQLVVTGARRTRRVGLLDEQIVRPLLAEPAPGGAPALRLLDGCPRLVGRHAAPRRELPDLRLHLGRSRVQALVLDDPVQHQVAPHLRLGDRLELLGE